MNHAVQQDRSNTVWRDARVIFAKELAVERRSKVALRQVIPFVITIVLLFAFALDRVLVNDPLVSADEVPTRFVAPGLYWIAVLFSTVLLTQRSIGQELEDGAWEQLRLWGLDPAGIFLGKAAGVAVQLLAVQVVLAGALALAFELRPTSYVLLLSVTFVATIALAAVASCYGALSAGIRVRETLVPVLLLPATVPVLLGSVQAWQAALIAESSAGWPWVQVVGLFAVIYVGFGVLAYGALMEE
jgi:heme exporter protein B